MRPYKPPNAYTHTRQTRREVSIEKLNNFVNCVSDDVKEPEDYSPSSTFILTQ
jgi:hypothetical protein